MQAEEIAGGTENWANESTIKLISYALLMKICQIILEKNHLVGIVG